MSATSANSSSTTSSSSSSTFEATPMNDSPYSLYPSDNPGVLITPVVLKGDNYIEWATEFSNSLSAKRKLGFIDGTILKPTSNPDLARWTAANSMIVGWMCTSIDSTVRSSVPYIPDARLLWDSLRHRFSVKNGVRKQLLQDEITNCKQNGQSVLELSETIGEWVMIELEKKERCDKEKRGEAFSMFKSSISNETPISPAKFLRFSYVNEARIRWRELTEMQMLLSSAIEFFFFR